VDQSAFRGPEIPADIEASDLDKEVRSELLALSRDVADRVARHLVAAGQIIDDDPDLALAHAVAARRLASRIAVVREAVGLAAYAAGDWATAITELRTYHRMTGRQTHLAEIADSERALGRPERAVDIYRGANLDAFDKAGAIELLIVAAGARADLGQHDAAVSMLDIPELTAHQDGEWAARLRYAYADALLAAGRREDAREWFSRTAAIDHDDMTDAAERLLELDGITIEDDVENEDRPADHAEAGDEEIAGTDQPVDQLAGDESADEERSEEPDHAAPTHALSFLDAAAIGGASEDRLAEDLDGGIDVPAGLERSTDVDSAAGIDADTTAADDDEKTVEDAFVAEAAADADGAEPSRPPT
jgi:tetratricopeptide (TPR) repeat protein